MSRTSTHIASGISTRVTSGTSTRRTRRTGRRALVLGAALLGVGSLLLIGVGSLLLIAGHRAEIPAVPTARPALMATPTVDPSLILHPRSVPMTADLSNDLHMSGTDYPAYPGRNVITLSVRRGATSLMRGAHVALSVTMPGMAMAPIRATLTASGRSYRGALTLPMFGTYRVAVVIDTLRTRASGITTVTLPLPGRQ